MTDTVVEPRMTRAARRVLDTAARLFYQRGITGVGVDLIAAEAGVTKKTIYDRFGSKDNLVVAYLRERDQRWRAVVDRHVEAAADPREAVVAVFDSLEAWQRAMGDRGCAMINARAELTGPDHPARELALAQKQWLRARFAELLEEAGIDDAADAAVELLLLHEGAVVMSDVGGIADAVERARHAARRMVDRAE
ncbi:TetR/AcrR family transcriptional regulator [Glycomyces sp. TRM65418]|uniref:TetR/AcrR family transcriptional regulator n=1 Tax=Glycomyces sp. TRM65418 TaxID=2867006 RepID=UPI001CE51EC5|nr:TetR/AcrR family transcriptional regulator [Glycomyces sp. TRM65418]MCC3765334.1 TetR/AcrR family transcriptional regulator [Glycomyces sp. TRM65418]QZD54951.1 TetR/AcrR family transcriptional regulator [Glycomyces sp. TRM65418]